MGHPVDPHMSFIYLSEPLMGMEAFGKKTRRAALACLLMIIVPMAGLVGTVTASTTPTHVIADQTWTAAGNPYLIDDMLVIMPDKTLTIEEGVVIEFSPSGWLDVRGDLNVFGTAADPVVFTIDSANATSSQRWGGIQLQTDDFDVDLVMRNAVVSRANTGVGIACCHQGSILIEDSTFLENGVAISGYAGYDAIINNVTFMNNTAGVDSADKDITHSTFIHNMWGIRSAERIDVSYSLFEDNDVAASGGRGVLHCNVIQDNRIGVQAFFQGWALEYNLIQDNYDVGVIIGQYGGSVPHAWGNSFLNNGMGGNNVTGISVDHTNNINIDFEQNWWGTTNSSGIDAVIHDFFDASQLGIVDYTPTLTADSTAAACQGGGTASNDTGDDTDDTDPVDNNTGTIDLNGTDQDDDDTGITPDTNGTEPLDNNTGTDSSTNGTDPIGDDDGTVENDTDPTPRISLWPGKVNQHNENGVWMTDPDGVSGGWSSTTYSTDYGDRKLEYCQKFWPDTMSIQLRDFRETITFWTRGNTDPHVSTRDVYECVLGDGSNNTEPEPEDDSEPECSLTLQASPNALMAGEVLSLSWTMTGDVSPEVMVSLIKDWTVMSGQSSFQQNTGSFDLQLPGNLDADSDYHVYVESAENGQRTTVCWKYATFDVLPEPEPECSLTLQASPNALMAGEVLSLSWTLTGDVSPEVMVSLIKDWTVMSGQSSFQQNTGSFDLQLPGNLDADSDYHVYVESAENGQRTTVCWKYAAFDVLPEPDDSEDSDDSRGQGEAEYEQQIADLQERERQAWEFAMEECDRAWDELDEQYMMMVQSLEEQMLDELEMEQFGLDDSLSIRYEEYDVQYTELLIQLSEAENEDEAALIIQGIQSLRESEQQVIEGVFELYHARIAGIVEQYDAMIDALDDEALDSLRHGVDDHCEEMFAAVEEQFAAEYDGLDSWTEDDYSCNESVDERCTDGDEDFMEDFGVGRTVPGFTGVLAVAAMSGAVLLVGRLRDTHAVVGELFALDE